MSMKKYYDDYWSQEAPPPTTDGLAGRRLEIAQTAMYGAYGPIEAMPRPLSLLDCGSGTGETVSHLASTGIDAIGMDISEHAIERAETQYPHLHFFQGSVEDRPWPVDPEAMDVVLAFEVIEHLLSPRQFLLNAFEVLKPGGHIAISCPYHGLVKNLAICFLAFDKHFDCEGDHIRFFSQQSLGRLLEETGFIPDKWVRFGRAWGVWSDMFVWAKKPH